MFDVQIFTAQGNQVFTEAAVNNSVSVNVKDYLAGMYIVKIKHQKGLTMKKFIKH
jgi:hypothetical protein